MADNTRKRKVDVNDELSEYIGALINDEKKNEEVKEDDDNYKSLSIEIYSDEDYRSLSQSESQPLYKPASLSEYLQESPSQSPSSEGNSQSLTSEQFPGSQRSPSPEQFPGSQLSPSPEQFPGSQSPEQTQETQQTQQSTMSLQLSHQQDITINDKKIDQQCLDIINRVYLECQDNLRNFFDSNIDTINSSLEAEKFADGTFLQIEINTKTIDKFILEINICEYIAGKIETKLEYVHISLFTKIMNSTDSRCGIRNIRGLHFTLPSDITTPVNKQYSHLYIGHIVAEDSLGSADAANKFIRIVLNSMGTYFETQTSISRPGDRAKESVIKFITLLKLNSEERRAIGKLLKNIGAKYKEYFKTLAASGPASGAASVAASGPPRGGMKIMKYNKVVEKSNSKDGKYTLVNNKELKINKIKDKIKILKQDKIKNKDKIIKQIKLIEDIKTKIKIEKERAKQKHKEKASIIKRKASVSKTPKTTTAKPKTTTAKPKTTTTKPKTPKTTTAKPKTTKTTKTTTTKPKTPTAKPRTPRTTTAKPKTPKTTTAKPKTPKTTTAKPKTPKTTTAKPKTTKRQVNK